MGIVARIVKICIGWVCGLFCLYRPILGGRALVVALHRVEHGESRESMTMPADRFAEMCRFFARHFRVVALSEIVSKLERGEALNGELAITFDDGYADFHDVAAPILAANGLTATVFLVSGFVGESKTPWWDEETGQRHAFMDWEQARALIDRGFTMGGHTRTHPDLGKIQGEQAWIELTVSREELERGLGAKVDLFAYPYGYDQFMSEDNRHLVAKAGYRCCCGYGDFVEQGGDPFRLGRLPLSIWYSSAAHLGGDIVVRALRRKLAQRRANMHSVAG